MYPININKTLNTIVEKNLIYKYNKNEERLKLYEMECEKYEYRIMRFIKTIDDAINPNTGELYSVRLVENENFKCILFIEDKWSKRFLEVKNIFFTGKNCKVKFYITPLFKDIHFAIIIPDEKLEDSMKNINLIDDYCFRNHLKENYENEQKNIKKIDNYIYDNKNNMNEEKYNNNKYSYNLFVFILIFIIFILTYFIIY